MITEFTINNADYFTAHCHPNSVQVHVQRMRKPCAWGTHVEITALAAMLEIQIFVAIKKNKNEYYWASYGARDDQKWVNLIQIVSDKPHHMEICHENDHYDVILTANGTLPSTLPPAAIMSTNNSFIINID